MTFTATGGEHVDWQRNQINECEKRRIRDEIDAQIEEFLKSGGRIDVLSSNQARTTAAIGSVWFEGEELPHAGQ